MKVTKRLLTILLFIFSTLFINSQEYIHFKNGSRVKCKIIKLEDNKLTVLEKDSKYKYKVLAEYNMDDIICVSSSSKFDDNDIKRTAKKIKTEITHYYKRSNINYNFHLGFKVPIFICVGLSSIGLVSGGALGVVDFNYPHIPPDSYYITAFSLLGSSLFFGLLTIPFIIVSIYYYKKYLNEFKKNNFSLFIESGNKKNDFNNLSIGLTIKIDI